MVQEVLERVIRRVAFTLIGGRFWTGGYNYLFNLFRTLDNWAADRVTPVLFVGDDVEEDLLLPFRGLKSVEIVRSGDFDGRHFNARLAKALLLGKDGMAERAFTQHAIDVVFEPAAFYGWRLSVPVIAWIPDFQHRHLSQLFSKTTYWKREIRCRIQVASNRHMLLSSEDARKDCETFYPASRGNTSVVRFAVIPNPDALVLDPAEIARKYGLPRQFYYLPNQFWKHKNHSLVIEALAALEKRGVDITVAVSGKQEDPYNPDYYSRIESMIESFGIGHNFRILGMIPYEHLIALMRGCRALLNPSLCEGWSTTVEEAKSLGVPMLLSDLSVHREQAPPDTKFFDPYSVSELAELIAAYDLSPVKDRVSAEQAAIEKAADRVKQYALDFADTVDRRLA